MFKYDRKKYMYFTKICSAALYFISDKNKFDKLKNKNIINKNLIDKIKLDKNKFDKKKSTKKYICNR